MGSGLVRCFDLLGGWGLSGGFVAALTWSVSRFALFVCWCGLVCYRIALSRFFGFGGWASGADLLWR